MPDIIEFALGTILGNMSTAVVLALVYFNFLLFEDYFRVIIWSILFSQALRGAKENVCRMLAYLSHANEIQRDGLLYSVVTQLGPYLMRSSGPTDLAHKQRRMQEFILDNGIFIFAMIGAVSIYVRMFSWLSFVQLAIALLLCVVAFVWVADRRIFHYRIFVSDEVLVSTLLLLGCCTIGVFVLVFLGTESYVEGSRAAMHFTSWVHTNVINDERTRKMWGDQVHNGKAMVASGLREIEGQYNSTMWFGPLKALVLSYYDASDGAMPVVSDPIMNATTVATILDIPTNMTWTSVFTLAYAQFNLTSTDVTDWTSKGLEISSMAFGSVFQIVFFVLTFVIAFISIGIKAVFFVTSLFYLLCTKWDPIERFVYDLMPISPEKRPALVNSLRRSIEGVFSLPMKISSLHAIVTLVSLSMMANDFVYLGTFITFFISIVPIIPAYLVCVPWVLALWSSASIVKALLLFVIHYVAFSWIDQVLYEKSLTSINAYVSALSVVFGVYVFGLEGVVFGPLLVCGVNWAYEVSNHGIQAASMDEAEKADRREERPTMQGNIFSNAYRAISGGLNDNLSRRFSFDATSPATVCVTLQVHALPSSPALFSAPSRDAPLVRFIASKDWTYEELLTHLRHTLKVYSVCGLYAVNSNAQVLSPAHLFPNETLRVEVETEPRTEPDTRVPRPPVYLKRNKSKTLVKKTPVKLAVAVSPSKQHLRRSSCSHCVGDSESDAILSPRRSAPSLLGAPISDVVPPTARFRDLSSFQAAAGDCFRQSILQLRSQSSSSASDTMTSDNSPTKEVVTEVKAPETVPESPMPSSVQTPGTPLPALPTALPVVVRPESQTKRPRSFDAATPDRTVLVSGRGIQHQVETEDQARPSLEASAVIERTSERRRNGPRRSQSVPDFEVKPPGFWKRMIGKKH
ncbi:hypothetical protein SPRG_21266 [Saprolegnia parasitica CBS 223.65]|uniref:Transmembrane protein n=1 Tax=Saprolegnia parasitica (strain CBS 223.65) TaxID=695850 RepID=A0A067BUL9_SAPPC|nr:hypothetical protein SPRG_21266 [Saprolegnia parasitica CBS 223.65]KDO20545.1 hypothetical protein SPRG_21266 [Saprolegnia parasitica CBS 223.65]|eukprot:XP_012208761.1 hypothetical protein SPRG_21266 [Saprolegnia parasitica CBS 223.65]